MSLKSETNTFSQALQIGTIEYHRPEDGSQYIWHGIVSSLDLTIGLSRGKSGWEAEPVYGSWSIPNMRVSGKTRDSACKALIESSNTYIYVVATLGCPLSAFDTLSDAMAFVDGLALEHSKKSSDDYEPPQWINVVPGLWDDHVATQIFKVKYERHD